MKFGDLTVALEIDGEAGSPSGAAVGVRTHCPYCALQCGIVIGGTESGSAELSGDTEFDVNRGRLCVKGFTALEPLRHADRLLMPLARAEDGDLEPVEWSEALDRIAERIRVVQRRHGLESIGVFGSGALTNEKAYLLGKFARVALRTPNIDYNGRFCMSSAAAAANRALGLDRGLTFRLDEIPDADVVLLVGSNPAETMPPLMRYFEAQKARGGRLIVVDPRRTATAAAAGEHLSIRPGTDAILAHGLLHVLIRERLYDASYVAARTEGFDRVRSLVAAYWPALVERVTGVPEARLVEVAHLLGRARNVIILTGRGPEQQSQGVANAAAYINLALALGAIGREGSGYGCLTGQGNGQGGREHGQKADQLPGYRDIRDPEARRHVAGHWGVDEETLPGPGLSAQEMLNTAGTDGGVRALLVFGSNPAVSAADTGTVAGRLASLDLLVVSDFFLSETAAIADFVLPTTQWAEEDGTVTNLEGRVIRRRRAFAPPRGVRSDLRILMDLADRLGAGPHFRYSDSEAVFDELRRVSAGGRADYGGITYERIDREGGVLWPSPASDLPPDRLFRDRFPTPSGRARFDASPPGAPAELPDSEYPLFLTTGRLLAHYQTRTQTGRVQRLRGIAPRPLAQIHPTTADRYGVRHGAAVTLTTRRGSARFAADLSAAIRTDTVFLPFHWGGAEAANLLTNPVLDPISRMPEFKVCAVRIEPAAGEEAR